MIRNRKHGHIGLATRNVEVDSAWYQSVLGFELIGNFVGPDGGPVHFLKNDDIVYEMYQMDLPDGVAGKIDHYSFDSQDVEKDYAFCLEQGYTVTTNGIEEIPTFWEKGIRFFKIASPTGEEMEFCQIL